VGAHIFLVGEGNFDICVRRGLYGCVAPSLEWNTAEIIAGVLSIEIGDLVFFYVKNQGVYGLWKVTAGPFFDEAQVWSNQEQAYPYRFTFEPYFGHFPRPISLTDILDLHDKGRIWTFDLNPVQKKNQNKITMDEARELLRLLLRNNPRREAEKPVLEPYIPPATSRDVRVDLSSSANGRVRYEGWLNAWFISALARGELRSLLGNYREFLNLVPTSFNRVMDIFLTHVAQIDSIEVLHKFTCIELKADRATEQDLAQVLRYEDWLARKLAGGDHEMIQTVLVASRFSDDVLDYVKARQRVEEKTVRLISYQVEPNCVTILLNEERPG